MTFDIAGPAGRLEARWDEPRDVSPPRAVAVVAAPHPQLGGTMQDRIVFNLTQGLLRAGVAVLRFNFRGVGTSEGASSEGQTDYAGEQADYRAALDAAAARHPSRPLWAAGYSFGAYVALTAGAADPRVSALIAVSPVADGYDFSSAIASPKPKFIIHGERDELAPLASVRRFYATLAEPRELVVIDGADHVFDGHASEVADAIEDLVSDFAPGPTDEQEGGSHHA